MTSEIQFQAMAASSFLHRMLQLVHSCYSLLYLLLAFAIAQYFFPISRTSCDLINITRAKLTRRKHNKSQEYIYTYTYMHVDAFVMDL